MKVQNRNRKKSVFSDIKREGKILLQFLKMERDDIIVKVRHTDLVLQNIDNLKTYGLMMGPDERRITDIVKYVKDSKELSMKTQVNGLLVQFKEIHDLYDQHIVLKITICRSGLQYMIIGLPAR